MRLRTLLALLLLPVTAPSPSAAAPDAEAFVFVGTLSWTTYNDSDLIWDQALVYLDGTVTLAGPGGLTTGSCHLAGTGLLDGVVSGIGVLWGQCGPKSYLTCVHVRAANELTLQCLQLEPDARTLTAELAIAEIVVEDELDGYWYHEWAVAGAGAYGDAGPVT